MPTPPVLLQEIVGRTRPLANPDAIRDGIPGRCGRYGEDYALSMVQKSHLLADEGSYFFVTNPTPGTGIAGQAAPTAAPTVGGGGDTKPFIFIQNGASPSDSQAPRIYLDYVRLRTTTPGTNGTAINFVMQIDSANRVPTSGLGGTALTPINPNMDSGAKSQCIVQAGNILASASGQTARNFPNIQLRPVLTVSSDIYIVSLGGAEYGVGSLISSGTGIVQQSFGHPPAVLGPGQSLLIFLWMPAQTVASSFELDAGWWER